MGNKSKMFRGSMSGFNKDDVNKYIIDINNEFSAKEEDYTREIASLREKLTACEEKINDSKAYLTTIDSLKDELCSAVSAKDDIAAKLAEENIARLDAENKLSATEGEIEILNEKLRANESELTSLKESLTDKDNEISKLLGKLEELSVNTKAEEEKASELADAESCEKIRMYDELRGNIGDILLNANKNADEIVRGAEKKAADMARVSRERADAAKRRLVVVTGRTVAALKKNAIQNADNCVREFRSYSDDISHISRTMSVSLEKKYGELSTKMEALGNELEEGIKAALREFDKGCSSLKNNLNTESDK